MWQPRQPRRASVQELLPLERVVDGVVCLKGGQFRAVIEAQGITFALKTATEQEAIVAAYRAFLNALGYPIQVLVRVIQADVDEYLAGLRGEVERHRTCETLRRLALDHEAFVRRLARERNPLQRRFYVIVPARSRPSDKSPGLPWRRAVQDSGQPLRAASRQLDHRCREVAQGLAAFDIATRRLETADLVSLWNSCLRRRPAPALRQLAAPSPIVVSAPTREVNHEQVLRPPAGRAQS